MDAKKLGISSALLASACCVGPILLVLLGLGGIGLASFLGKYHWYLQGAAVLLLSVAWWVFLRERRKLHGLAAKMKGEKATMATLSIASIIVAAFLGMSIFTAVAARLHAASAAASAPASTEAITLSVKGMTCFTCELSVQSAVKKLDGVTEAKASGPQGTATIRYDPARVTPQQLVEAIKSTGYTAALPAKKP